MKAKLLVSTIIIAAAATGCTRRSIDIEGEKRALLDADKAWALAASTHDMERLWSYWTDDAKVLISADWTIDGIDQIKPFTINARKDPNFAITWSATGADISPSADMGYTYGIGSVTRSDENGNPVTQTKPYLIVWEKQRDGSWRGVIEN